LKKRGFDWDAANIAHLARHEIQTEEAEQIILNRPLDLESYIRNGEQRSAQIGETDEGRILVVVTTMQDELVRVVTAWPAKERLRNYLLSQKRNGNVGRAQDEDLRE
jgi:hypothetical protein